MFSKSFWKERSLRISDKKRTKAAELTLKESFYPLCLVTILFFLWGFSYGLLDTLNKHFQNTLGISKARSSGLQAAYFGCVELEFPSSSFAVALCIGAKYFQRISFGIYWSCSMDSATLQLSGSLYLGVVPLRDWCLTLYSCHNASLLCWILRLYFHYWQRTWIARDSSESLHHR